MGFFGVVGPLVHLNYIELAMPVGMIVTISQRRLVEVQSLGCHDRVRRSSLN